MTCCCRRPSSKSGLDVPTANTLIVHRADMFGLAQLYQLRGRVGRSKVRAFALFTLPVNKTLTATAERRLKVLQSLDTLGAGFQLASHDLDIRGAGNLLGEEQSGHIKEVGFELYQQMLEEAVAELKGEEEVHDTGWSPQISVGTPVMIPEHYVPDLHLQLGLYRRLGELTDLKEIDGFGAEMIDRFGPLPIEVQHLLKIVYIKSLCRTANVEKLDAGPKGVVVQLRNKEFPNPAALVGYIAKQGTQAKIRADHSIFFQRELVTPEKRLGRGDGDDAARRVGEAGLIAPAPPLQVAARIDVEDYAVAFICAISRSALLSTSTDCAPITAYCPSMMKQGTPVTPISRAMPISSLTASLSASELRSAAITGLSRPASAAMSSSTA